MHRIRCLTASAEGGFKINGPPRVGKGPMTSKEVSDTSNETSQPQPTQAGRIETCTELIRQAMKCLENNDKQCIMKLIEELIKANCHNGYAVGKETVDKVKDVVHELWLASDYEFRCGLLRMLRDFNVSKRWVRDALHINAGALNTWFVRCNIDWEDRAARYEVVKKIEDLLRRLGWNETKMCEGLWRFVGVDTEAFRKYGMEPCIWLNGLELLSDLRNPYWFGLKASDLAVEEYNRRVGLELDTTNAVDAVFFSTLLNTVKAPSFIIKWEKAAPAAKYVSKSINLSYFIYLGINEWPWPVKLNANELERILNSLSDEELAMFMAGEIDGDGMVLYIYGRVFVEVAACKDCPKRMVLNVLRKIIAERFGIIGRIELRKTADALVFRGKNAVRLLRRVAKYMHHPLRRLRAELILAFYDGKISYEEFMRLYGMTKYRHKGSDVKRNHAVGAPTQAAPQTHTHGEPNTNQRT
ncbi:LAGLIDADG family homing endonuclease [Vulcanisaeta sp. EB80]|uniref:LAGLIDADG family homing endonuclease n=1 Tax=Vulcanisaeta sp. EB80 TaxID=1650660 RepID=UPI00117C5A2D|nr:LAGLIDADG family homing endonuclease [Vulcanisaeta sp. EB80]